MATRLFSLGFEQGFSELNYYYTLGTVLPTISTVKFRTGANSLRFPTGHTYPYGRSIVPTTELRAYCSLNHVGSSTGTSATDRHVILISLLKADGTIVKFAWQQFNGLLYVVSGTSTILASASDTLGTFTAQDTWHQVSIAAKIHASAGWFDLYINGVLTATFAGNTGTSPIIAVLFGGANGSNSMWNTAMYIDDCYVDDTTSEASAASVAKRFLYLAVNANGSLSQFTGSDGNSTDNYLLVDDPGAHDGETTYVQSSSNGLIDSYGHATLTTPTNYIPVALITSAFARKTDALVDTEYQARLYKSATAATGTSKDVTTVYDLVQDRFTTLPDGSPLGDANINSTEIGYVASGSY